MSSGSSPPPAPNYEPIARASENASKEYAQIMRDQLAWAKEQYADNKAFTDTVKNVLGDSLTFNNETAKKDRARYEELYQPLEGQLVDDAKSYASDERKALERGKAMGTVAQQFDTAGEAAKRQLESYGIDPSATRYAALDLGVRTQKAAALAAAANQSDVMVDDRARALRSEAINVGRGYPGQIAQQFGTSQGGGTAAVGTQNQTYSASAPALGNPAAWGGLTNQAIGTWGQTVNNGYANQLNAWSAGQNQSSGVGSALGMIGGMVGSKLIGMMAEGGSTTDVVEAGGAIPASASPSGGAIVDDVPAQIAVPGQAPRPAALNVGEFVMPEDVVRWRGESYYQKDIDKARKEMQGATAKPEMRQQSALPV